MLLHLFILSSYFVIILHRTTKQGGFPLITIAKDTQTEIVIEKSRFICTLKKIYTEDEATSAIAKIKKEYWDATHNCTAYIIGDSAACQKSSDDGEPSGTAGIPMLEVLKKRGLTNVLAIVTRYFGGVKLGSGGLIRAYGKSVSNAINDAGLAQKELFYNCTFSRSAQDAGKIINLLYNKPLFSVADIKYNERVDITLRIKSIDFSAAIISLTELLGQDVVFEKQAEEYVELPL